MEVIFWIVVVLTLIYLFCGVLCVLVMVGSSHGPTLRVTWQQVIVGILTWPRFFSG